MVQMSLLESYLATLIADSGVREVHLIRDNATSPRICRNRKLLLGPPRAMPWLPATACGQAASKSGYSKASGSTSSCTDSPPPLLLLAAAASTKHHKASLQTKTQTPRLPSPQQLVTAKTARIKQLAADDNSSSSHKMERPTVLRALHCPPQATMDNANRPQQPPRDDKLDRSSLIDMIGEVQDVLACTDLSRLDSSVTATTTSTTSGGNHNRTGGGISSSRLLPLRASP